jgi:hypothetical protein
LVDGVVGEITVCRAAELGGRRWRRRGQVREISCLRKKAESRGGGILSTTFSMSWGGRWETEGCDLKRIGEGRIAHSQRDFGYVVCLCGAFTRAFVAFAYSEDTDSGGSIEIKTYASRETFMKATSFHAGGKLWRSCCSCDYSETWTTTMTS